VISYLRLPHTEALQREKGVKHVKGANNTLKRKQSQLEIQQPRIVSPEPVQMAQSAPIPTCSSPIPHSLNCPRSDTQFLMVQRNHTLLQSLPCSRLRPPHTHHHSTQAPLTQCPRAFPPLAHHMGQRPQIWSIPFSQRYWAAQTAPLRATGAPRHPHPLSPQPQWLAGRPRQTSPPPDGQITHVSKRVRICFPTSLVPC